MHIGWCIFWEKMCNRGGSRSTFCDMSGIFLHTSALDLIFWKDTKETRMSKANKLPSRWRLSPRNRFINIWCLALQVNSCSLVNHIVKSCFAPRPPMLAFLILGVEKEAYIEANRMLSPHQNWLVISWDSMGGFWRPPPPAPQTEPFKAAKNNG